MATSEPLQVDLAVLDDPERLSKLREQVISRVPDATLEALVQEAAQLSGMPMAAVSLVGKRAQLHRAATGLPPALAGGFARESSLCQFTVSRSAPLYIENVGETPGVPPALQGLGLHSYFGVPLQVEGKAVGSLCVLSNRHQQLSADVRDRLVTVARAAEARLAELFAASEPTQPQLAHATSPAFGELRNQLAVLAAGLHYGELAAVELSVPLALLAGAAAGKVSMDELARALPLMQGLADDGAELASALGDMRAALKRVTATMQALEEALSAPTATTELAPALAAAGGLAHHLTKLSGGVQWSPGEPGLTVKGSRPVVVASVAAALRIASEARTGAGGSAPPFTARVERCADAVELRLRGLADGAGAQVQRALGEVPGLRVAPSTGGFNLIWPAV